MKACHIIINSSAKKMQTITGNNMNFSWYSCGEQIYDRETDWYVLDIAEGVEMVECDNTSKSVKNAKARRFLLLTHPMNSSRVGDLAQLGEIKNGKLSNMNRDMLDLFAQTVAKKYGYDGIAACLSLTGSKQCFETLVIYV
jgi:hypothetical protein